MTIEALRERAPLLQGLTDEEIAFLESVSREVVFTAGSVIFEADAEAGSFYLITDGRVGLEVTPPNRDPVTIETIGPGELLGVSWLFPPYRWSWGARAIQTTVAVAFEAAPVRKRCESDTNLAWPVYKTVAAEAVRRLHASRIRLLDLYAGVDE